MSQNFSYAQIEKLGKYLQKAIKDKSISFLREGNFDQRFISKIAQDCFDRTIYDDLIKEIEK